MIIPKTITFSGLDGSGKSTIIEIIKKKLISDGYNVTVYAMYDDLSFYALLRKTRDISKKQSSDSSIDIENNSLFYKFMRSKFVKTIIFPLDTLTILFFLFFKTPKNHIVLIDRSSYDYILDVVPEKYKNWQIKLALVFSFKPFLPVFVNTPASISFKRKGEYNVDYLEWRRHGYSLIFEAINYSITLDNNNNSARYNAQLIEEIIKS